MDVSRWSGMNDESAFQIVRVNLSDAPQFCPNASAAFSRVTWPSGAVTAGPRMNCSYGACTAGQTESNCKATSFHNGASGIVALIGRRVGN